MEKSWAFMADIKLGTNNCTESKTACLKLDFISH